MKILKSIIGSMIFLLTFLSISVNANADIQSKKIMVNAKEKYIHYYVINDEEYVLLRDLANALNNSPRQFNLAYYEDTNSINIAECEKYDYQKIKPIEDLTIHKGTITFYKDWNPINIEHYFIDDRVFVRIKDIANILNFIVDYDSSSNTLQIVSSKSINYCGSELITAYYVPDGRSDYNWALEGGAYDYKGNPLIPGVSAAGDKKNFKYGEYIYIEGIGVRQVTDCGSAIKGWRIDICLTGDQYRNNWKDNKYCKIYKLSDL